MAKPEWGTKRICQSCGARFYDFGRSPITCPACGAEAYSKQLSAAGFQLKGSGWYATDFKGSSGSSPKAEAAKSESPAPTPCGGSCACH